MKNNIIGTGEDGFPTQPYSLPSDKYFTPSIEDIRVGYECEIYGKGIQTLTQEDVALWLSKGFNIRVPYLTKEQIEKEGWTQKNGEGTQEKNGFKLIRIHEFDNKGNIVKRHIRIWKPEQDNKNYYKGECKDINTFRYICKLLGI